ncbi:hypothetical protein C8F01DRAFT_1109143 [Mycena amicta]|nr:hypothetical protein C8F01DRAFT_1109143 [Mycena amicta]
MAASYIPVTTTAPQDEAFDPFAIPEKSKAHEQQYTDGARGYEHYGEPSYTKAPADLDAPNASLVQHATNVGQSNYQDLDYAEPKPVAGAEKTSPLSRFLGGGIQSSLQRRIDMKKRGIGRQRHPIVVWTLTVAMCAAFIYELVANKNAQGSPLSFKPVVNYMLGPSSTTLINIGARFPPCMKLVESIPPTMQIGCLNNTATPVNEICSIEDICGFGGFRGKDPNQSFRFVTPIFLHAGIIHIALNMLAQLSVSAQVEREMGSAGFLIVYMTAGIFGNVLGANFALPGRPSVGASGAIFGTLAVLWVDLFAHWKYHYRPGRKVVLLASSRGFAMALFVGTIFYPVISVSKRHKIIMITARILAIPIAVILFVVLTRNFYTSDPYAGVYLLNWIVSILTTHQLATGLTTTSST